MIELYLIRHAQSQSNVNNHLVGGRSSLSRLTQYGETQAELLGERLKKENIHFDEIYSSTAVRSRATSGIVAKTIGFPKIDIIYEYCLEEQSRGDWEGRLVKEVFTKEVFRELEKNCWDFKTPNGESQREVENRMYGWVIDNVLYRTDDNLTIGLFSHGNSIKNLLRKLFDTPPQNTYSTKIDNTSITRVNYDSNKWELVTLNDSKHLL